MTAEEIRRFRPTDRAAYLELYETVFGTTRSVAWFDWKYGENPYVEDPAIIVAIRDGDLVGARSFLAMSMATGRTRELALQPSDAMVHPDHRRQGLFTAMTEQALSHYAERDPAFCFNFPNPKSLPGNLDLGWREVDQLPTYYRIHRPGALVAGTSGVLGGALDAAAGAYSRFRRASTGEPGLTVRRLDEPPVSALATLADRTAFDGIHATRDRGFYRWRLAAPGPTYETYLALRDGEPVGALVVGDGTRDGVRMTRVMDALAPAETTAQSEISETLVARLLSDREDVPIIADRGGLPGDLLRRAGFLPDTALPLRAVARPTTLVARPIGDTDWTVDGRRLPDPASWDLSFIELDSS